ncbi:MAG: tRNA (N6-isopentenyl adenosine(37)-C2)-methylthiotransferase MiaB, partial [Brachybacterium sp.]|nr:tRNA (N6-isopentenyl adenosine(37)-C2)-methylthiotransferase MiaB [Brachybacterium sp.]
MSFSSLAPPPAPESRIDGAALQPRGTYQVRTFGCQMNVHDSERLTGMLEDSGYVAASGGARRGEVDVIVFNTFAV